MTFSYRSTFFTAVTMCWLIVSAGQCAAQERLQLSSRVVVSSRSITLGDLLAATPKPQQVNSGIASLDVAAIKPSDTSAVIRRSYLEIRLQLAGLSPTQVVLEGPEEIEVRYQEPHPLNDTDIEAAASETMASLFGVPEDDVQVQLTRSFMRLQPASIRSAVDLRAEVLPPSTTVKPGAANLVVRLWNGPTLTRSQIGRFNVLKRQRVAVARVSLQRNMTIDKSDVQFETRFLSASADEPAEADIFGQRVRTGVRAGQILSMRDLSPAATIQEDYVVQSRDPVTVTAISGPLRVQLHKAEAMQRGRIGDTINIRNIESREIITGRVVSAGAVEIRLR